VSLPVPGPLSAVLFQPDGGALVRSGTAGHRMLTLLSPAGTVSAQVAEPAAANDFGLVGYAGRS
jgi:hypothetical protein